MLASSSGVFDDERWRASLVRAFRLLVAVSEGAIMAAPDGAKLPTVSDG